MRQIYQSIYEAKQKIDPKVKKAIEKGIKEIIIDIAGDYEGEDEEYIATYQDEAVYGWMKQAYPKLKVKDWEWIYEDLI